MSRARELSRLGNPNIISADSSFNVGFGTATPKEKVNVVGVVSATQFFGDGSGLDGIASAGIGTALSDDKTKALNTIYFTNDEVLVTNNSTVNPPDSGHIAYTQAPTLVIDDTKELTVSDGDDLLVDVLGISTGTNVDYAARGNGVFGNIYVDNIESSGGQTSVNFPKGLVSTGVATFHSDVSIGGTLTYEDVKNIDSVGLITARTGIDVTAGVINASGDGINASSNLVLKTATTERLRIGSVGQVGLAGANYGTSGQVMTSQGASAAPQWADAGGGAWEYVKTTTVNNAATCHCTMPTYTGFGTALYAAHKFIIRGLTWPSDNDQPVLGMRFSLNNGASADTSANYRGATTYQKTSGNSQTDPQGQTFSSKPRIPIVQGGNNDVGVRSLNYMEVLIPAQLNIYGIQWSKQLMYPHYRFNDGFVWDASGNYMGISGCGMHQAAYTNHITGLELGDYDTAKNLQHCSIVLYRMKLS